MTTVPPADYHTAETPIEPRRATLIAAAVYCACTLALAWPLLLGRFLVNPGSDQYLAGYAFREFAAATLKATGGFPLWNPYLLGGMPYVAAMHGDIFYPTFLLRLVLPTDIAMSLGFAVHLFLAGLFTYLFLRAIGLSFGAALIGGVAFMLGGNIAGLASPGHDGKLFISALLPATLIAVVRLVRDGRPWAVGALAFVIGLSVLTPHPQLLQYLLLGAGAFGVFLAFSAGSGVALPRPVAMRRLALAAVAVLIGFAMGAIQFLPVREYVAWSPRAGGKSWDAATSFSMPPEETLNFLLPQFSGILDQYWGRNGIHLHSEYLGVAVLILAGLAWWKGWGRSEKLQVRFWTVVLVIALLWALGGYTPFYRLVYALVPGTKFFRAPSVMLFMVAFCAAVLAAFGSERALRGEVPRHYLMAWGVVTALVAILGVSGGLTNLGVAVAGEQRTDAVLANAPALQLGALRMFAFSFLAILSLLALQRRRVPRDFRIAFLAVVVALDLWSVSRRYWMFSPPAATLWATDATIDAIKKDTQPSRVLALQTAPTEAVRDPFLVGNGLMSHRIRSVLGYHGNELGRYQRLGDKAENWRQVANPNFWRLMNVRYVLANSADLGVPSLRKVVGPVKNAAGTEVTLFETTDPNPFAWVAPVIVKAADDAVAQTVLNPQYDVRSVALFDSAFTVEGRNIQAAPPPSGIAVKTISYEPGHFVLELATPAPSGSALVASENYYPGWSALVDGTPVAAGRVNYTLIGVPLREGARRVELRFASQPYETGKSVTLLALGLAVAMWGMGALMGRSRSV